MPWESRTVMNQREQFVEEAAESRNFSDLCRRYGISRKTGYKWVQRAQAGTPLEDQSRRPEHPFGQTPAEVEEKILAVRSDNPAWGGLKIKTELERRGETGIPSARTCGAILKRNGCISPEESQKHQPYQRFERDRCNALWQTDFKGDFLLGDSSRCFPLDILDDCSRFCIRTEPKPAASGVKETFLSAFREYGLPDSVLSDNGSQFSGFRGGYTQFERWLMDLDILPIHGRIRHPQTQGKIERFHRTMKLELLRTVPNDMEDARVKFALWRWKYNHLRPHAALGMKPPAQVYEPSSRALFVPKPYDYGSGMVRKVNNWGYLRFGPVRVYLSETMADTYLEIRHGEQDTFVICYRNFQIAVIDAASGELRNRKIQRL